MQMEWQLVQILKKNPANSVNFGTPPLIFTLRDIILADSQTTDK